jgi:hypothetical protein
MEVQAGGLGARLLWRQTHSRLLCPQAICVANDNALKQIFQSDAQNNCLQQLFSIFYVFKELHYKATAA